MTKGYYSKIGTTSTANEELLDQTKMKKACVFPVNYDYTMCTYAFLFQPTTPCTVIINNIVDVPVSVVDIFEQVDGDQIIYSFKVVESGIAYTLTNCKVKAS